MVQPSYSVTLKNNIVIVKISGDWNIETDIGYLTMLDETIAKVRSAQWALFADLRGWCVSQEVINYKHNKTIQLARNNQQCECWLVDNLEQGAHIQHHIENAGVPFAKFTSEHDALQWLIEKGFGL